MAPPPEYDKEPKAPDKSATTIVNEVSNNLHCLNDQQINSDHKLTNPATNSDIEKNKVEDAVENLDDGRLRALLDEAITYKCPKDREGKSDLFKNLLEAAEQQDDQASEAATRGLNSSRNTRVRGAGRRSLAHSNSLQDLVAALAAEPAPRRHRHPPAPAPVSARATQGGSLPSGVDTSFLLGEEPGTTRAGYLATVRCVNPPPLAERRVSASDANSPPDDTPHRRSKPAVPTYTTRATLEISSSSVCSGRAVTTTTASNQVRTSPASHRLLAALAPLGPRGPAPTSLATPWHLVTAMYPKSDETEIETPTLLESKCPQFDVEPIKNDNLTANGDMIDNKSVAMSTTSSHNSTPITVLSKNKSKNVPKNRPNSSLQTDSVKTQMVKKPQIDDKQTKKNIIAAKDINFDNRTPIRILSRNDAKKVIENGPALTAKAGSIKKAQILTNFQDASVSNSATSTVSCSDAKEEFTKSNLNRCFETNSSKTNQTLSCSNRDLVTPNSKSTPCKHNVNSPNSDSWVEGVNKWYQSLNYNTQFQTGLGFKSQPKLYGTNEKFAPIPHPGVLMPTNSNVCDMPTITNTDEEDEIDPSYNIPALMETVYLSENNYRALSPKHKPHPNKLSHRFKEKDLLYRTDEDCDIIRLRKKYRESVGQDLVAPKLSNANPRNIRPMTISKLSTPSGLNENNSNVRVVINEDILSSTVEKKEESYNSKNLLMPHTADSTIKCDSFPTPERTDLETKKEEDYRTKPDIELNQFRSPRFLEKYTSNTHEQKETIENNGGDFELVDLINDKIGCYKDSFPRYYESHQRLFQAMEATNDDHSQTNTESIEENDDNSVDDDKNSFLQYCVGQQKQNNEFKEAKNVRDIPCSVNNNKCDKTYDCCSEQEMVIINTKQDALENIKPKEIVIKLSKTPQDKPYTDLISELSAFLTFPKCVITNYNRNDTESYQINNIRLQCNDENVATKSVKKKKKKSVKVSDATKTENMNKTALKVLLFENVKSEKVKAGASTVADNEGDSAIPFSCITTPEVVASCNTTTSSTSQATVAVDPKPLQLGSCYRAVASLTGAAPAPHATPAPTTDDATTALLQPRSVISSSYNGLSLARSYGATATADEYKKSLDENGNAVQGFSSPVSGSGQHKKPRRKKSSKNETVITSHQIDGYQGNKDLNEVLRFIESNAEQGRGAKLPRAKHKDDCDDKAGKKRSAERRKDKEKAKRASSLEELSRTKLEDLTAPRPPEPRAEPKPERRSWGDDYRAPDPPELTDFQTVTKRRKPRRRPDEPEREPPRRRRPSPARRRPSAPPSDRSNDSDEPEGARTPPPAAPAPPPPAPHASYADIARTRHNIPDLIESCNFYADGDGPPPPPAADADGYPALGGARARAKGAARRKERPAPDVLGERRPPVILAPGGRARDLDGVTFGFDVNEQLLGAAAARRCDLLRDAADPPDPAHPAHPAHPLRLRYRPPRPPPDTMHLHQIVDYVAHAWEDAVRCGGKARYYSE